MAILHQPEAFAKTILFSHTHFLCTEGFHGLLKKTEIMGDIRGVSICRNGPKLTHLLFADDSFFFRAKENECQKLLEILAPYERALGQKINRAKTTLFFSKSTSHEMQESIKKKCSRSIGGPTV